MLTTQKEYHAEGISPSTKKFLEQKIELLDKQIDTIVYKLYDLTDDGIKIVEGKYELRIMN
jgi:adenine-specific DNA-methyltransferase